MKNFTNLLAIIILFSTSFNAISQDLDNGLVGYFPFNNTAIDKSGNCNSGFVNAAEPTTDRFGNNKAAYYFDGNTFQYIQIPGGDFYGPNFSYSVWAYAETLPAVGDFQDVLSIGGDLWQDQSIQIRNDGYGGTSYNYDESNFVLYSNIPSPLNQWVHLVMTRSDENVKLYQDGVLVDIINNPTNLYPFFSTNNTAFIGMRHNFTKGFQGKIDDLRIYNREITEEEVIALYNDNNPEHFCYTYISVTDTLLIDANIVSYNPVQYDIQLKVYPNPTKDHLVIEIGDLSKVTGYVIKISNSAGNEVFNANLNQSLYDLDMNKWPGKGIYFLNFYDDKSNLVDVKKIILQ